MDPEKIRWGREEDLDIWEIRDKLRLSKEGYVGKVTYCNKEHYPFFINYVL